MASNESVKDVFKHHVLKEIKEMKLLQLDSVLYKWFTAWCPERKPMAEAITIGKTQYFFMNWK